MTTCPRCDGPMKHEVGERDVGRLVGLERVTVTNLPALVCTECGEFMVEGKVIQSIMRTLAIMMITDVDQLRGCEVRYLRRYLRETQEAFAERLGVARPTIARWENKPQELVKPIESYAIRSVVAAALREGRQVKSQIQLAPWAQRPGLARSDDYRVAL